MESRTESQIVTQAPLKVQFGGETYEIKPLTVLKARAWREKFHPLLAAMTEHGDEIVFESNDQLRDVIMTHPEAMAEAVFLYAPELPKDKILEVATENELVYAFSLVWGIAFAPFFAMFSTMRSIQKAMKEAQNPEQPLDRPTRLQ